MSSEKAEKPSALRSRTSGALVYKDYRDNFVIWPGREADIEQFVNQTYGGQRHKLRHTRSSNSEDALTWSCFDTLKCLPPAQKASALAKIWSLAFDNRQPPAELHEGQIFIGKKYGEKGEETEVDASIEGKGVLVFIEAKLYSPMSLADKANRKPHDQIARKLRIGAKQALSSGKEFFFILLDIAPVEILRTLRPGASLNDAKRKSRGGFPSKWLTAYWFARYKSARGSASSLSEVFKDIPSVDIGSVAKNMGWLTWADVYKVVLRAVIPAR
ncbi:MAG: hypothetical protein L0Z48_00675 [candidate division Zixibacteria bacterium]|nr:hypothetical protein [candidate division Zixibacteria bacterium]MCI0595038.1 hypothetical protein [candidate division Zixibacteria bacterium]